jgi:NDP-sugar pyrophosphorylase family protein
MRIPTVLPVAALLLPLALAAPRAASAGEGTRCRVELGPDDRFVQGEDLVITAGSEVRDAVALRGSVVVRPGARVRRAVAVGGSVVLERGARVREDAVALGGDVRLEPEARVGKDVVALGGKVMAGSDGQVGGHVLGMSLQLGQGLGRKILAEMGAEGCEVVARAGAD